MAAVVTRSIAKWLIVLALAVALLPSPLVADSLIAIKVDVQPPFPLPDEEIRLRLKVEDRRGGVLANAKVVAIAWMESGDNPGMAAMEGGGSSRTVPVRIVGQPLAEPGTYHTSARLPMSGRWRLQVWANSGGANGKVPLELDVLSSKAPQGIDWLLISVIAAIGIVMFAGIWRLRSVPTLARTGSNGGSAVAVSSANLLNLRWLRSVLRSRWYPLAFQVVTAAFLAFSLVLLLVGAPVAHDNFGSAVTWVLWWPLLPLLFLLFGRIWCAICPMSALSDFVQRLCGRKGGVPSALRRWGVWLIFAAFLFITWFDVAFGLASSARSTGYLLLLVTTGVVATGVLFERRAWCRYLCFIGGLSGNYAMASAVELRATPEVCRKCKTLDCYRGNDRAPGCPMFEYPRAMNSNRCCNLCARCIKACPHDSLRLSLRQPTAEVATPGRGRWEEALLAAGLLAIVATQTFIMLSPWADLTGWARKSIGVGGGLLFTLLFGSGLLLAVAAVFAVSAVSGRLRGETAGVNLLRYAYALIPLGLMGHLAHNLNHILGEGKSLFQTLFRLLRQPDYGAPAFVSAATVQILQFVLVFTGTAMALYVIWRLSGPSEKSGKTTYRLAGLPHALLVLVTTAAFLWMFGQGMVPRMQMAGTAHEEVSPALIEAAKASVRAFVGSNLDLAYVHLEEHGYQDIILRGGDRYYFVDIANNMVVSTFNSRPNLGAVSRVPYGDVARVAVEYALRHYPNLANYGLQFVETDEVSPYTGGYVFQWRQFKEGVGTPNQVKIITDGLGQVAIFSARDTQVTVPTTPVFDQETALTAAKSLIDFEPTKASAALDIGPELSGRQVLRWTMLLEGSRPDGEQSGRVPRSEVVVDALSGELLSVVKWN
ncbi:MAG: 4Fe-4S binding protein [Chloroflexi bacterium]|nr:4Fe-4S binding protein [Chloroflexota bacterium]